jgi:predicted transcriptional regulator
MKDKKERKQLVKEMFENVDRLHISYTELARMLRLSVKSLYRWKNGECMPQLVYIPMIKKLVELFKERKKIIL